MTHSTASALPSVVCALFCGALFFSGLPLINYLPRFMLSGHTRTTRHAPFTITHHAPRTTHAPRATRPRTWCSARCSQG